MSKKEINGSVGYTNEIYKVQLISNRYQLVDTDGKVVLNGNKITGSGHRKQAFERGLAIQAYVNGSNKSYRKVPIEQYNLIAKPLHTDTAETVVENPSEHNDVKEFIHKEGIKLKPKNLLRT